MKRPANLLKEPQTQMFFREFFQFLRPASVTEHIQTTDSEN